ncbi:MAG: hypothetical protein MN733_42405, partial [Nitrososphaera sp.]|nr:hypothetical protein [Nitrososphaera sp.]
NKSMHRTATVPRLVTLLAECLKSPLPGNVSLLSCFVLGQAASSAPSRGTAAAGDLQRSGSGKIERGYI